MKEHKEYKIMLLSIKDGKWYRAATKAVYTKTDAIKTAERLLQGDSAQEYPKFSAYKIMERTVSEWKEVK